MTRKAPSYLRQLAQPVPAGGAVLSVPRRARGRVSEKFGLAGVPVIQDAEETIATPLMSRHVPVTVSAETAARRVATSRVGASRPAAVVEKSAEVRLESKPRAKAVAAPREEAAMQSQRREATQDVRGERERSVSAEAVPQSKRKPVQTMEAAAVSQRAEKHEAERKDEAAAAVVDMRREVLRVERERVIESEVRSLEAKPKRASKPAPQLALQAEPKPAAEQRASIHIGTVEVRIVTPAPPVPAPMHQRTMESQPARLGPPTPAPSLARSLAWNCGLVQG